MRNTTQWVVQAVVGDNKMVGTAIAWIAILILSS